MCLLNGQLVPYDKLVIATGASPKKTLPSHEFVIRLRDIESVKELEGKLKNARRILIIGNGGIATEFAYVLI